MTKPSGFCCRSLLLESWFQLKTDRNLGFWKMLMQRSLFYLNLDFESRS